LGELNIQKTEWYVKQEQILKCGKCGAKKVREEIVGREKGAPMITNWNQAWSPKCPVADFRKKN